MAYIDQTSWRERPAAAIGTVAINAGIGIALIAGLGTAVTDRPIDETLTGVNLKDPPPPPPPEQKSEVIDETLPAKAPLPYAPPPPMPPLKSNEGVTTTREMPSPGPVIHKTLEIGEPLLAPPPPPPPPGLDPISASPRNAPGSWIRPSDYRSSWIRRELAGDIAFTVGIGTDGKVDNCRLNGSTGHSELDSATCRLIERRARFNPAQNRSGDIVPGSYSGRVRWQLPE